MEYWEGGQTHGNIGVTEGGQGQIHGSVGLEYGDGGQMGRWGGVRADGNIGWTGGKACTGRDDYGG